VREGKLSVEELSKIVQSEKLHERVIVGSEVGEDCAVVDFNENYCVISTDPITGVSKHIGKFAFHINCNDIIASGGVPTALLVTLLAPPNAKIEEIESVMYELYAESRKYGVDIIGGHTEYTKAVNQIIVSCTAMGECSKTGLIQSKKFRCGDSIYISKHLGIEWTLIKALEEKERVETLLSKKEYDEALSLIELLTIIPEGEAIKGCEISAMHDITEGGLLGALTEMFQGSEMTFELFYKGLPMLPITQKLIDHYQVDIKEVISSGSLIIMCSEESSEKLVQQFHKANIPLTQVGKVK